MDGEVTEVEGSDVPSEWEQNVTVQSQSSGDTPTIYSSRNIYQNSIENSNKKNNGINDSTFGSVASETDQPLGSRAQYMIPREEFADESKPCPLSPEVHFAATCLDFTSEDRKREYKFLTSDEKKEIKNVTIKYSDDGVVSASYSPPAFLPSSPVPVRTNMTSTYPTCTPISPILSSPTSPISSSFRVSFSTQKKGKISDIVEKKYETQLDMVFNNKVAIVSPPRRTIHESDDEKNDPRNNDSFASLQNFYPEVDSPMKEVCSPADSISLNSRGK